MGFVDVHSFRFSPSCTSLLACFASRLSRLICKWLGLFTESPEIHCNFLIYF